MRVGKCWFLCESINNFVAVGKKSKLREGGGDTEGRQDDYDGMKCVFSDWEYMDGKVERVIKDSAWKWLHQVWITQKKTMEASSLMSELLAFRPTDFSSCYLFTYLSRRSILVWCGWV